MDDLGHPGQGRAELGHRLHEDRAVARESPFPRSSGSPSSSSPAPPAWPLRSFSAVLVIKDMMMFLCSPSAVGCVGWSAALAGAGCPAPTAQGLPSWGNSELQETLRGLSGAQLSSGPMAAQGWKALPAAFCISQSFSQQNPGTSGQFLHRGGDLFRQCFGMKTNPMVSVQLCLCYGAARMCLPSALRCERCGCRMSCSQGVSWAIYLPCPSGEPPCLAVSIQKITLFFSHLSLPNLLLTRCH